MKLERAVGIDLGTTNSAIAMMSAEGDELFLLEDRFRRKTFPSVVGWSPAEETYIVGWEAWNRRGMEPAPVASVKRKMGSQKKLDVGPHQMLPEEISAKILTHLREEMTPFAEAKFEHVDVSVDKAVITVPAYFDAPQIDATRKAGELAGLDVVSLVQEPTAAAMYYAWKHGIGDGVFLVYDLGGGTFDVSIIRSLMGEYQVLGLDGDNYLGGDDFDRRLAEYFRQHLVEKGYDLDLDIAGNPDDAVRFFLLTKVAREVKESLSTSEFQYVARRDIFEDHSGQQVTLELEISREQFEDLIEDLVDQSIDACSRALAASNEKADVSLEDVEYVLLVGGSTRIPMVQTKVDDALCGEESKAARPLIDEPDTCVALGASIHASNVAGVRLVDEEQDVAMTVTSPLYTHETSTRLVGRLELGDDDVSSRIESVALLNPAGDVAGVVRPERDDGELVFSLEDVSLPDRGHYPFDVEFCDADGAPVVSMPIRLSRGSESEGFRPTGSALSNPSVLAKDIYLEIVRDGESERQILLDRGTSLPAEEEFRFRTADQSGAVILRLYQNRFPIRTIHLAVPEETEVGTPVDLTLKVDETMSVVASGEVQGQKFWAQIEPPPPRELKDWEEIEAVLERVDDVARKLWGYEGRYFRQKTDPLVAGIRETARTDPDKLQSLVMRLEDLLEDYQTKDTELTPGLGRLNTLLDAIKRVVYRGDDSRQLGMGIEEWRQKITELEQESEEAYRERNQQRWTHLFNQIQAIWESLAQDEYRFKSTDTAEHIRRLHATLLREIDELRSDFADFNLSPNPETEALQRAELEKLEEELERKVEMPLRAMNPEEMEPSQAKPELDRLYEATTHIRRKYERLPTLGLVTR